MLYFFRKIAIIIVVKSSKRNIEKESSKNSTIYSHLLLLWCYFVLLLLRFLKKPHAFSVSFFSSFRSCSTTFSFPLQQSLWHKKKAGAAMVKEHAVDFYQGCFWEWELGCLADWWRFDSSLHSYWRRWSYGENLQSGMSLLGFKRL